jgi:hypothetical protein
MASASINQTICTQFVFEMRRFYRLRGVKTVEICDMQAQPQSFRRRGRWSGPAVVAVPPPGRINLT